MGKAGIIVILIFVAGVLWAFALHWTNFAQEQGFETVDSFVDKQKQKNNILR